MYIDQTISRGFAKRVFSFLMTISLSFFAFNAFAQPANVVTAYNYMKEQEWLKAKEKIDLAAVNPKTSEKGKTWFYRGKIYVGIYQSQEEDMKPHKEGAVLEAVTSFRKAREIGSRSVEPAELNRLYRLTSNMCFQEGVNKYNEKDYPLAIRYFEECIAVKKEYDIVDSLALFNIALAAENQGDNEKAIEYYKKCIELGYNAETSYSSIAFIHTEAQEDDKALAILKEGRSKFPSNQDLLTTEINLYLKQDRLDEALENLNLAIGNDPTNTVLYFARGTIYSSKNDNTAAEKDYLKAIELKEDYFDAQYNLGALYFNRGADMQNTANGIVEVDAYNKAKAEADAMFQKAIPYLERALELEPNNESTLQSLKQIYARTGDTEKYNAINEKLKN